MKIRILQKKSGVGIARLIFRKKAVRIKKPCGRAKWEGGWRMRSFVLHHFQGIFINNGKSWRILKYFYRPDPAYIFPL